MWIEEGGYKQKRSKLFWAGGVCVCEGRDWGGRKGDKVIMLTAEEW